MDMQQFDEYLPNTPLQVDVERKVVWEPVARDKLQPSILVGGAEAYVVRFQVQIPREESPDDVS